MKAVFVAFVACLLLGTPLWAADPRVDQAFALIDQGEWDAAERAATGALADATTDIERFDAQEALATLNYYIQDSEDLLPELIRLDAQSIRLFGRTDARRLPVLELLGLTYDDLDQTALAIRTLTSLIRIARLSGADPDRLHFGMLYLADIYLAAGDPQTAAIVAADLALAASEAYGAEDEIALEAALIRALAHIDMGHPVEATVHAMPLIWLDPDSFADQLPELADRYSEFENAVIDLAAQGRDRDETAGWLYEQAQAIVTQREAVDNAQLVEMESFASAIYAKDIDATDRIGRSLTATVLADDPFPVGVYALMIPAHLRAGSMSGAIPWVKRLADVPPGYLATLDLNGSDSLTDTARWLAQEGRLSEALELNALVLNLAELREDRHAPAVQRLRLERSSFLALDRRYGEAKAVAEQALADNAAYSPVDPSLHADALAELGRLSIERLDYTAANAHLSEAIAVLQSAEMTDDMAWATLLNTYANTLTALGRGDEAIPILQQSNALREQLTGPRSLSTVTGKVTLAAALADSGQEDAATAIFETALSAFGETSDADDPLKAPLMLAYADLLDRIGRTQDADQLFVEATQVSQTNTAPGGMNEILTLQLLANRAWSQDRLADASSYLAQALDRLPPDDPSLAEIRILQGRIALERDDLTMALSAFRDATDHLAQPGRADGAHASDYLPVYIQTLERLARADQGESSAYLDEIFVVAQGVNSLSAGRALSRAAARWTTAPELSARLRQLQDYEANIQTLRANFRDRLAEGADTTVVQARLDGDLAAAEAIRRDVAQTFPDYNSFTSGQAIELATIAAKLRTDEVLVMFATSPEHLSTESGGSVVLALTKEALHVNSTADRETLAALTVDLRCAAALTDGRCGQHRGLTRGAFSLDEEPEDAPNRDLFDLALAHRAYDTLLGPVSEALDGKTRLIVVPDQTLTALPFHLLVRSAPWPGNHLRQADWLLRDMSIVVVPTVASFDALRSRGDRVSGNRFLGVGDPLIGAQRGGARPFECADATGETVLAAAMDANGTGVYQRGGAIDTNALANLPALPDTRCELQHAARLFGGDSQLLLQGEATETRIKALSQSGELASFGNLSFATHGLIAGEVGALDAGLVLTPPSAPDAEDDGLLTVGEIAQLRLNANFVLLSACNTAAGGGGDDEGLSGLASAFFYAGARSLLVSHWPVYSDAATRLTSDMLSTLDENPELGLADALRVTMLGILDDPSLDDRAYHPAYWAPFMIVGEGAPPM